MLDSVIWARDQYLVPGGLMIPSHAALRMSLFADDEYITDKFSFWNSVYGFKMSCMQEKAYDDIIVRTVQHDAVLSRSEAILKLPLHRVRKDDLTVTGTNFLLSAEGEVDHLHGFVIHFDIFFATDWEADISDVNVGFSTGPLSPETHWQQALALIDTPKFGAPSLKLGDQVKGKVALRKGKNSFRELEITIDWQVKPAGLDKESSGSAGHQTWQMR